jgi:hypothetical protein
MNKMKARDVISKSNNKSFYRVTETGWKWLWLEICPANNMKNPMISRIMKTGSENRRAALTYRKSL